MTEWVILRENGRYDFRRYLRRLCISAEEMQIDPDSIDPIPYHYGLQFLKNMPLIEPLETAEVSKILELVIAIDTSGSCSLPVVQRFLDEICLLLSEQEYFFRKIRVHLIQCDCVIQDHRIITNLESCNQESHSLKIQGPISHQLDAAYDLLSVKDRQDLGVLHLTTDLSRNEQAAGFLCLHPCSAYLEACKCLLFTDQEDQLKSMAAKLAQTVQKETT